VDSIYEQIGGMAAVGAAVDELDARVLDDPRLAPSFRALDAGRRRDRLRAFVVSALGGPRVYAGPVVPASDVDRVAGHLAGALRTLGVPTGQVRAIVARIAAEEPAAVH
jgi:truncated hemoglobin YjbI